MKIAIPVENGRLAGHFGHCRQVMLLTVSDKQIVEQQTLDTPPHQPGAFPAWLAEQGTNVVIAGGMGQRALDLLADADIEVVLGAPSATPEELAAAYLAGELTAGANTCSHGPDHHCEH
jgi:ATP-binding protein involved in chromosome partitioning